MTAPTNLHTSNNLIYQGESTEFGAHTVPGGMICIGSVGIGGYGFTKWAVSPPADSAGNATIFDTGPINLTPGTYYLVAVSTLDGFVCDTTQKSNQITFIIRSPVLMGVTINAMSWLSSHIPFSQIVYSVTFSSSGRVSIYVNNILESTINATTGTYKWTTSSAYPTDTKQKLCIGTTCRDLPAVTPIPGALKTITIPSTISLQVGYSQGIGTICIDTNNNTITCPTGFIVNFSNPSIVSLSSDGSLTGISGGISTMTVSKESIISNICTITVATPPVVTPPVVTPPGCTNPKYKRVGGICASDDCDGTGIYTDSACISGGGGGDGDGGGTATDVSITNWLQNSICLDNANKKYCAKNWMWGLGIGVAFILLTRNKS